MTVSKEHQYSCGESKIWERTVLVCNGSNNEQLCIHAHNDSQSSEGQDQCQCQDEETIEIRWILKFGRYPSRRCPGCSIQQRLKLFWSRSYRWGCHGFFASLLQCQGSERFLIWLHKAQTQKRKEIKKPPVTPLKDLASRHIELKDSRQAPATPHWVPILLGIMRVEQAHMAKQHRLYEGSMQHLG